MIPTLIILALAMATALVLADSLVRLWGALK